MNMRFYLEIDLQPNLTTRFATKCPSQTIPNIFSLSPIYFPLSPQLSLSLSLSLPARETFSAFLSSPLWFSPGERRPSLEGFCSVFPPWRDRALALTLTRARPPPLAPAEHHLSSGSPPVRPLTRAVGAARPQPLSLPTEHLPSCF
jgi:hypothetical protein